MKEIKAIIRPSKLSPLRDALHELPGFPGMTLVKAEGMSAPSRIGDAKHTVREELTDYTAKIRIEIVAQDALVDGIVGLIARIASTGKIGDGLVWVTPVERAAFLYAPPARPLAGPTDESAEPTAG